MTLIINHHKTAAEIIDNIKKFHNRELTSEERTALDNNIKNKEILTETLPDGTTRLMR